MYFYLLHSSLTRRLRAKWIKCPRKLDLEMVTQSIDNIQMEIFVRFTRSFQTFVSHAMCKNAKDLIVPSHSVCQYFSFMASFIRMLKLENWFEVVKQYLSWLLSITTKIKRWKKMVFVKGWIIHVTFQDI